MKYLFFLLAISAVPGFATVKVSSPTSGASAASPVHFVATATTTCSSGVSSMGIYKAPNVLAYKVSGSSLNTYLTLSSGTYNTVVQEWDACGSTKTAVTITVSGGASSAGTIPASSHVFVVVEENHSYSQVVGSSSMPYLNSLANKYGLSTQYYANTHPSIGNYFMMVSGQLINTNDSYCPNSAPTNDNIVRHLLTAGKTWKSYAEDLPYAGYTSCAGSKNYVKKHNPLAFFSDVANSSEKYNLVPFTQFSKDLANNNLPNFSFIVPNLMHDAHDGSLSAADSWLKTNIAPLISSATFQKDGILIIVFDESLDTDTSHGGGHIACLVIGPKAKLAMKPTTLYQHQNLLRTVMQALGLSSFPGTASTASGMTAFF